MFTYQCECFTFINQIEILKIFINYLARIAEKTKVSINYSNKHFSDFLNNASQSSFFLRPTNKYEIHNIISSLNSKKSSEPNSIPTRISKLPKKGFFSHLPDIFNISLSTGVFSTILKAAKVVPVHKMGSKLDVSNYCPILLLFKIEKNVAETNVQYNLQIFQ